MNCVLPMKDKRLAGVKNNCGGDKMELVEYEESGEYALDVVAHEVHDVELVGCVVVEED